MSGTELQRLDLAAVIEMSQAVSGEIVLDRLIERLMVTVVEHAGALRGLLLLPRDGQMCIVAEAVTKNQAVAVNLRHRTDVAGELPESILNHVSRTHKVIILDDAPNADRYLCDPYMLSARPRSVLCLPLVKQKQLVGVLYLESGQSSRLFTEDQLAVLRLLASQAAISIENAELFLDVQKTHEQAHRAADELRRSFDMIPTLAWSAFPDGTLHFINKRWQDFTGMSEEVAVGGAWVHAFHPDDIGKVADKWGELLKSGVAGEVEARMRRIDGKFRSFIVRATPMRDDKGNIVKWYGTNTDIDDLRRAELAQEALARAGRLTAMGELTVSIAHEVNQPLMAIVTNGATCLQWLNDDQLNIPEARKAAERVVRDGHRAGDIITSIRALARKSRLEIAELDINEAILEVLMLMRSELQRRTVGIETDLATDATSVFGDRVQIQQVVLNLIMNGIEAIGATSDQPRLVRIRSHREDSGYMVVAISDTGAGLDPAQSEKIFEAFFTTKSEGIGMGLSICRSIVEAHGGRLWASPNLPCGSVFHFTVPTFVDAPPIAHST